MELYDRRLILVVGKGGVGRTTVASAIASEAARRGKTTLLVEVNANDRIGQYFGKPPVGTDIVPLGPNLWAVNTNPGAALAEYGLMVLKFKSVYEMVFENRVTKAFLRAIPGLDDYAVLGKVWYATTEEKKGKFVYDTVVFDMPASGHSVSMLRVPQVIVETVPEGPLTRDARKIRELLADKAHTAAVLVTLAEEMPVNEAIELEGKLAALGIHPQQLLVNQVYPEHFPDGSPVAKVLEAVAASGPLASPLAELVAHAQLSHDRHALNARYLAELVARAKTPVAQLPMRFVASLGPADITALAAQL